MGEAQGRITLDIAQFMGAANQAQGAMGQLDGAASRGASGFQKFTAGFNAFGLAMIPAVGIGITSAIDLEQAMANINASLGGLDASTLNELTKGFQDLGAASQFSATEVAKVGDELAKSGFDPSEILNATEAVIDLSQATGADLMTSTTGISAVMHIWTEEIVGTKLALTDASEAADIFTVAANESSASVEDIIAGVRNFGPTAAGLHIGFNDAAGAIAFFTQNGLKAADSGVSLTRGIEDLMKVAQDSPEVLDQMGISAFDLEGNFIGLPALFDQLQTATAGMTDEQRQLALSTIFGAESIDVMTIAALNGGDPLRALIALTEEQGVASEQSALRMDTLGAQFDTLKEGATTLVGSFMQGLIPGMRFVVDGANRLVDVFMKIPGPIKTAIGAVMALAAGFAALNLAIKGMALFNTIAGGAGGAGIVGGLGAMVPILLAVAAAAGVAYAAIRFNFLGIGDAVRQFIDSWNAIGSLTNNPISRFLSATSAALRSFDIGILNDLADAFSDASDRIGDAVDGFQDAWDFFFGSGDDAQKDAKKTTKATGLAKEGYEDLEIPLGNVNENLGHLPGITADANDETTKLARTLAGTEYPVTRFGQALTAVGAGFEGAGFPQMGQTFRDLGFTVDRLSTNFQQFRAQGLNPIEAGVLALGTAFPALQTAMVGVYGVVNGLGDAFSAAVRGDWAGAFDGLAQAAQSAGVVLGEIGNVVVNIAGWVMGQIPDVWAWLRDTAIPALGDAAVWLYDAIVNVGSWAKGIVSDLWPYVQQWASDALGAVTSAAGTLWGVIVNVGSWAKGIVSDIWPYITTWAGEAMSAVSGAAGTLWNVIVNVGSWAKGIVSDIGPFLRMWASDAWAGVTGAVQTLWDVVLDVGSWAKGELPDIGGNIQDWVDAEYASYVAAGEAPEIGPIKVDVSGWEPGDLNAGGFAAAMGTIGGDPDLAAAADAEGYKSGFVFTQKFQSGFNRAWDWVFGTGGGGGGAAGGPGGGTPNLSAFIANIGRGFDQVASEISGMFRGMTDSIINGLESDDSMFSRIWDFVFENLFDLSNFAWMGQSVKNLAQPFVDFFNDVVDGAVVAWQGAWDLADFDLPDFDITSYLPDIGFDVSDLPGYDRAIAAVDELVQMVTDPIGYAKSKLGGGGDAEAAQAAPEVDGLDTSIEQAGLKLANAVSRFAQDAALAAGKITAAKTQVSAAMNGGGGYGRGGDSFMGAAPDFSPMLAAITAGMNQVTSTIQVKSTEWGTAMSTALANLSGGGTGALGAAVGGGAAGLLGGLVTSITTGLTTVTTAITTSGAQWAAAMAAATTQMTASASVGFIGISTAAQAGMAAATAAVVSGGAQMSAAMTAAGAAMSAAATSAAQTTASVLQAGMAAATGAVASNAAQWPGIIAAAGGAMAAAGFSVGAAAGQGVAAGLLSTLGAVQSAAAAIISTVAGAMTAAAQIHSPSRMTAYYGQMMGAGLISGLDSMQSRVAASSAALMQTASPYMPQNQPGYIAGGGGVNAPITIRQVDIHTQGSLTDADKKGLAREFGEALKTGVDIQYLAHGATS